MSLDFWDGNIAARIQNFRWNVKDLEEFVNKNRDYFFHLDFLRENVVRFSESDIIMDMEPKERIFGIFRQIYREFKMPDNSVSRLFCCSPLYEDMYKVCLFHTLCSFLHASKRIKGKSLRKFVREYSPTPDILDQEEDRLRRARQRLLSKAKVYNKKSQWAAITEDVEYEWTFYYDIDNAEDIVQDTFKRVKNLYSDIDRALDADRDDGYLEHVENAYKKFLSKLHKIKYENYLRLQKTILSRINQNKEYYGINLYRLERRLRPYITTIEVEKLLACQTEDAKKDVLEKSVVLLDICYPKLYEDFSSLPYPDMILCAGEFPGYLSDIAGTSCLIFDELVEKGTFGEDWKNLFREITNEMASDVLFRPDDIDVTVGKGAQTHFERLLCAPVIAAIYRETNIRFSYM